jgi:hypothetical protein
MLRVFASIVGVQGSNFTKDVVVVNGGMLIKYSPRLDRLIMWTTYQS